MNTLPWSLFVKTITMNSYFLVITIFLATSTNSEAKNTTIAAKKRESFSQFIIGNWTNECSQNLKNKSARFHSQKIQIRTNNKHIYVTSFNFTDLHCKNLLSKSEYQGNYQFGIDYSKDKRNLSFDYELLQTSLTPENSSFAKELKKIFPNKKVISGVRIAIQDNTEIQNFLDRVQLEHAWTSSLIGLHNDHIILSQFQLPDQKHKIPRLELQRSNEVYRGIASEF